MKSVVAAEVAALSAWRVLSVGDRVGALVFNDVDITVVPPHRSRERVMQILKQVVEKNQALSADTEVKPDPGKLAEALKQVSHLAGHDCLVCLITDADGLDTQARRFITQLSQHNDVLTAFIYDPLEKNMPAVGRLRFADKLILLIKNCVAHLKMTLSNAWNGCRQHHGAFQYHCCHCIPKAQCLSSCVSCWDIASTVSAFKRCLDEINRSCQPAKLK